MNHFTNIEINNKYFIDGRKTVQTYVPYRLNSSTLHYIDQNDCNVDCVIRAMKVSEGIIGKAIVVFMCFFMYVYCIPLDFSACSRYEKWCNHVMVLSTVMNILYVFL